MITKIGFHSTLSKTKTGLGFLKSTNWLEKKEIDEIAESSGASNHPLLTSRLKSSGSTEVCLKAVENDTEVKKSVQNPLCAFHMATKIIITLLLTKYQS